MRRVTAFGAAVDSVFSEEPVRYLQLLGVSPTAQRQGIGSALLADGIGRADAANESIYLETSAPDNVAYSTRFGFEVVHGSPGPVGDNLPIMWRMLRPA